jgi:hypothetical protein
LSAIAANKQLELPGRQRLAKVIALQFVAAIVVQKSELFFGFHAFGDGGPRLLTIVMMAPRPEIAMVMIYHRARAD